MEDNTLEEMRERFGDEQTEEYLRLAKAVRSLVWVWEQYADAERGSAVEVITGKQMEDMIEDVRSHPKHAAALVEAMVAIIVHMRRGGTYEAWYESLGLTPEPRREPGR